MILLFANDAYTTISGSITNISTTVNLASGSGALFPTPAPGSSYFKATFRDAATGLLNEIVHVTNRVGDVLTIVRAQESTTAQNWNAGDSLDNLITAGSLAAMQQGGSLINTSVIYSGIDTSGSPNQVNVASTTPPWVGSLVEDATFRIRIANTNTDDSFISINGGANVHIVHPSGLSLAQSDLHSGQEAYFTIDNSGRAQLLVGANVNSQQLVPVVPATTWYVDIVNGTDSITHGLTSGAGAFETIQYAIDLINNYFSASPVTINVAAGNYTPTTQRAVASFGTSLISSWILSGHSASDTFLNGSVTGGRGVFVAQGVTVTVQNFFIDHYYEGISSFGQCTLLGTVSFDMKSSAAACMRAQPGGSIFDWCSSSFFTTVSGQAFWQSIGGGSITVAYHDVLVTHAVTKLWATSTSADAICSGSSCGSINFYSAYVTWDAGTFNPVGLQWIATTAGGIDVQGAGTSWLKGTLAGVTTAPGWFNP